MADVKRAFPIVRSRVHEDYASHTGNVYEMSVEVEDNAFNPRFVWANSPVRANFDALDVGSFLIDRDAGSELVSLKTGASSWAQIGIPMLTTTARDALTGVNSPTLIYNTTTNKLNFYNGSAWEAVTSA